MSARIFRLICLLIGTLGLIYTVWSYVSFSQSRDSQEESNLLESRKKVLDTAIQINNSISQIANTTRQVANDLSTNDLTVDRVGAVILNEASRISAAESIEVQAIGVIYKPDALEGETDLCRCYFKDEQGVFQTVSLNGDAELSNEHTAWFTTVSTLDETWSAPTEYITDNDLQVIYYAVPFTRFDKRTLQVVQAGVVFAALSMDDVQQLVRSLDMGDEGYAYIVSGDCTYLAHPDMSLINTEIAPETPKCASSSTSGTTANSLATGSKSSNRFASFWGSLRHISLPSKSSLNTTVIQDVVEYKPADLESYVDMAIKGKLKSYSGTLGGRPCLYFFEPIPAAGWTVGVVLQKDPHGEMINGQKQNAVRTALLITVSFFLISIFAFQLRLESQWSMWAVSLSTAGLMVGVIALIWYLEIVSPSTQDSSTMLSSHAVLETNVKNVDEAFRVEGLDRPIQIPTGIFIESFSVEDRNITLTGYIWQKFPKGLLGNEDAPVVVFSDAQSQEEELAYRFEEGDHVVVGNYFRVSQVQTFASDRYPLDLSTVSLQLQTTDLQENYLLVPDLDSYNGTNPSLKPGVKSGLVLNNWNIVSSAFTYQYESRDMNFGSKKIKQYKLPMLQFDITLKRFIVPSLLSYGITAMVTAILMFSLVVTKAENLRSVLTEAFALFFVLVVAHVGLRSELAAQGIVYLEALFIILYCLILFGVLNGLLQFLEFKMPLLSYQDGLFFKLLYWPILFGSFLIRSLVLFYPHLFQ